jgi:putative flippase GtrA
MAAKTDEHPILINYKPETFDPFSASTSSNRHVGNKPRSDRNATRRGRHRKPTLLRKIGSEHGKRLASFSLIGFGLFAVGILLQAFLVQVIGIPKVQAFIIQLALLVQVNFLANYRWTWGDRDAPFWRSCWRYNLKRLAGILLNFVLYPVLIHFGMNYLAANALLVVALTPVNYLLGHFWTFAANNKGPAKKTETGERKMSLQDYSQGEPELAG